MGVTVVDTDILIDATRRVREAVACLGRIEQRSALAVSVIGQMLKTKKSPQQNKDHLTKSPRAAHALHAGKVGML